MNSIKKIDEIFKRIFDVFIVVILLPILIPILSIISLFSIIFIGKNFLYIQDRPGLNCKIFKLYKFRTMNNLTDESGRLLSDSERTTRYGNFLRSTSLDELPSIFNVLIGDMSLVGPRPLLVEYLNRYNDEQIKRHNVRPGITGLAQINGRNNITWDEKFVFDLEYVKKRNLLLDILILFKTFFKIFKRSDINSSSKETMPTFLGNNKND